MNRLAEWLARNNVRRVAFAERIGVTGSAVSLLCSGKIWPSHDVAAAIERETGGEVTANDFIRRCAEPAP